MILGSTLGTIHGIMVTVAGMVAGTGAGVTVGMNPFNLSNT